VVLPSIIFALGFLLIVVLGVVTYCYKQIRIDRLEGVSTIRIVIIITVV
jgi:hypothetical protein